MVRSESLADEATENVLLSYKIETALMKCRKCGGRKSIHHRKIIITLRVFYVSMDAQMCKVVAHPRIDWRPSHTWHDKDEQPEVSRCVKPELFQDNIIGLLVARTFSAALSLSEQFVPC